LSPILLQPALDFVALDLPRGASRQGIEGDEANVLRTLVSGEFAAAELEKVVGSQPFIPARDEGDGHLVVDVTSYATQPVRGALDYVRRGGTIVLAGVKGFTVSGVLRPPFYGVLDL
jgi:threonine dehydrogenase-like Zn-dependent dehydrogenase